MPQEPSRDPNPAEQASRYSRQTALSWMGVSGQRALSRATASVVGIGGLGCASAHILARAGIGRLLVVDRDVVETSNLHRQILYTESDVSQRLPKAVAAARRLRAMRSDLAVKPIDGDLTPDEMLALFEDSDLVLDGSDNHETRYLLNEASLETGTPWIYAGAVALDANSMTIFPGSGPCLCCVFPDPPEPGSAPTCESHGVLAPAPVAIAAFQSAEALKILSGRPDLAIRGLVHLDLMAGRMRRLSVDRDPSCPCCAGGLRPASRVPQENGP